MTPHRRNSVPNQAATTNITMDNRERTGKIAKPSQSQEERRLAMGTRLSISRCTVSSMAKEEFPYPVNKNKALNQGIKLNAEEELAKIVLPVTSSNLQQSLQNVHNMSLYGYSARLAYLSNSTAYETYYQRLIASIKSLQDSVTLENNQALEQVLKYAMDKAVEAFLKMSRDSSPRTLNVLHKTLDNARQEAFEVFEAESDIAVQETMFLPYKSMLKSQLDNHVISIGQENENLVRQQATAKVRELVLEFKDNTVKIGLPLNETDLETRLVAEKERIHTSYTSSQAGFEEFESIKTVFKSLEEAVEEVCKERRHDNMVAYSKEVEVPLSTSKKIVLISSDNYDTEFSLKQYIRQVCLLNLDEGKPKHWPLSLKNTIIDNFIETDTDMRTIVTSRRGLWKNIKGFIQWLLWIFGLF